MMLKSKGSSSEEREAGFATKVSSEGRVKVEKMGKIFIWIVTGAFLAAGCSSPKVNRYETMAYQSASPENRLKIEQGTIGAGMSIEECKASCPKCEFTRKFVSTDGGFELWKVNDDQRKKLYLRVVNGRIEKVSDSEIEPLQRGKSKQPKQH
jgi:hypothetical protein